MPTPSTLAYDSEKGWCLALTPDLRMRARRVFPRTGQHVSDVLWLSATPENARDIEWFMSRFSIAAEADVMEQLQASAATHRDLEERLTSFLAGHAPPVSLTLSLPLRDYQAAVPQALSITSGLVLSDDLGLGKTAAAIGCLTLPGALPAVVVAPPHLLRQWRHELKRFAPHLRTHITTRGRPYSLAGRDDNAPPLPRSQRQLPAGPPPDVVLTSYHMARGWAEELAGAARTVIFDEGQQLRNSGTQIHSAATHLADAAQRRLLLSATPIHNYGGEIWHVMRAVKPGALGNYAEFQREWCKPGPAGKPIIIDAAAFGAHLRREGLMLRRTRAEVGRELPKLTRSVQYVDAEAGALRAIAGDAVRLAELILANTESYRGERMQATGQFDMLMRQATGIAKAPHVAAYVRMLIESGEPVVLFGWHRQVYEIWREQLRDLNPQFYTGSETPAQKAAARDAFVSGKSSLMIVSLRSGAGLDGLQQRSHIAVLGELDWSPAVIEQCIGRLDRDGQAQGVLAYFLLSDADDSVDPYMADVLGLKRSQLDGVRNADTPLFERVDTNHTALRAIAARFLGRAAMAGSKRP